ncbi:cytochrome c biogenesis protein CcdA, partial [Nocardiopsis dassonvillei subsp. albirubida]|nr:cytochrome c biogenesis protein CcdA [Nocardiopsis alborubida]
TVAATGGPMRGALLLAVYALGMAGPLFVLALLWDRYDLGEKRWLRGRTVSLGPVRVHTTSTLSGLLFIAIGVVFLLYDGTASLFGGIGAFDDQSYRVQEWLFAVGGAGIDVFVLGAAGMALLVAGAWKWSRARRTRGAEGKKPIPEVISRGTHPDTTDGDV